MRVRHLKIVRFRGIRELAFAPLAKTVILGPNNAGKSTVLEALDLLLHSGLGRTRPLPTEVDYFGRDPSQGFSIEAVIGDLPAAFKADVRQCLEGWRTETEELLPEPDGGGIEPVVRIRVRAGQDFDVVHEFAKDEVTGTRFSPRLRAQIGWVFDGRARDPTRQLAFFQGGLLDRLFGDIDLAPAVASLKEALGRGAASVNTEGGVQGMLETLAADLRGLGLTAPGELPQFEVGSVSVRELLQSLRLTLPGADARIPIFRQGRGTQRLLLVAVLLRLAQEAGTPAIGGFEEPEEALEPLRQTQIARMLGQIVKGGGQIFVVTHSPEVARAFSIDDFLLLDERASGDGARLLRTTLTEPVRQKYERWLDRSVVRALFARIPVLVEGPGDRTVFETFWRALVGPSDVSGEEAQGVQAAERLSLDVVNCEGAPEMPMMARLLKEAGKAVVVWAERDVPEVLERLRNESNWSALILHDVAEGRQNLEQALAQSASLPALLRAMDTLASTRGYSWDDQRTHLVSSVAEIDQGTRETLKVSSTLADFFAVLDETQARALIARVLAARNVAPFEMKGARQARIVAEAILEVDGGVPTPFAQAFRALDRWIAQGCQRDVEISMAK